MSVVLAEAVERAVTTAFTRLNGQVEAAVALEVDRRLEQIAAAVLAERLEPSANWQSAANLGAANYQRVGDLGEPRVCRVCGEEKPLDAFERGRRTCRECRRQQERDRAHRATADAERPRSPQPE